MNFLARQYHNQKSEYLAQRPKGRQGKTNCHFDRREKSFLDPSHSLGMTDGGPSPLRAWRLGGRKSEALVKQRCRFGLGSWFLVFLLAALSRPAMAQERVT